MSEPVINVRSIAMMMPEFVQWVVQSHGPQDETWTKAQYDTFVNEYNEARNGYHRT
jgi:hypothetical protein